MKPLRAILVFLVAASVAMLPLAGMAEAARVGMYAAHPDCCPEGKQCEHQMPKDCGGSPECLLKCFQLTADITRSLPAMSGAKDAEKSAPFVESAKAQSPNPPLPPPRV